MPDGRAVVKTAASRAFFSRGTGLRTSHIFTTADGAAQGLTGTTEFAPGAEVPWHTHNCEETVTILAGEALFEADGEQTELVAGDATWTPVGVVHRFANRGRGPLRILWTYGSVDATRTLVATGATTSIAAESQANPAATAISEVGQRRISSPLAMGVAFALQLGSVTSLEHGSRPHPTESGALTEWLTGKTVNAFASSVTTPTIPATTGKRGFPTASSICSGTATAPQRSLWMT